MIDQEIHTDMVQAGSQLALLPLKNVVMLPTGITPIIVARSSSILAVEFALKNNKIIFIYFLRNYLRKS